MNPEAEHISNAELLAEMRQLLPPKAFQRTPARVLVMALHGGIIITCFFLAAKFPGWLSILAGMIIAGHSLMCLTFLAHDLTHGSILAPGLVREVAESFAWGSGLISRTVWRKVHNQTHHAHYGTLDDPDRQFVESEKGFFTRIYCFLLIPNRDAVVGNPFIFLLQFLYNWKNLMTAFWPAAKHIPYERYAPDYSPKDKMNVVADLVAISVWQFGLLSAAGFHFQIYLVLMLGTTVLASTFSMLYIFTNHYLRPVTAEPSILDGCSSVIVPRWCDVLHSYFSFHTEHHLFPMLNPNYYPDVSRLLAKKYPEHYQRIPMLTAWRLLWRRPMFEPNPSSPIKA